MFALRRCTTQSPVRLGIYFPLIILIGVLGRLVLIIIIVIASESSLTPEERAERMATERGCDCDGPRRSRISPEGLPLPESMGRTP